MTIEEIKNRKGVRKATDIPGEVLKLLNKGKIETVNLTEWLAINQLQLIENTFADLGLKDSITTIKNNLSKIAKPSTMKNIKAIGESLYTFYAKKGTLPMVVKKLQIQQSDSLRCYATYLISFDENLDLNQKLNNAKPLIADKHFGVREIVWMALRPEIEKELTKAVLILEKWTTNTDENIRRFVTEVIRPRGVWCKHIDSLKEKPEQALPILEALKKDASKYVQDSVGNWLNDASKTKPDFVQNLCKKWQKEKPTKATEKIIKRAMRTILK